MTSGPLRAGRLHLGLLLVVVGGLFVLTGQDPATAALSSAREEGMVAASPPAQPAADDAEQEPFTGPQDPDPTEEPARPSDDDVGGEGDEEVDGDADDEPAPPEDEAEQPEDESPTPAVSTPAVRTSTIPPASVFVAIGVLLLGAVGLGRVLGRRPGRVPGSTSPVASADSAAERRPTAPAAGPPPTATPQRTAAETPVAPAITTSTPPIDRWALDLLLESGRALIDSGDAVSHVQDVLERIAAVNGAAHVGIIVLPTALIVSVPHGESVETEVAPAGRQRLRLDQVEEVVRVVSAAEEGVLSPVDGIAAIDAARRLPPPSTDRTRVWGYVLFTVGLAMILRAGLLELLVAAGLGVGIGALLLGTERLRASFQAFVPVVAAFAAAAVVFGLGRFLGDLAVFPPLVAPLVAFLPGAVLTTAVFELSTGHVISGSSRLAAGMLRLVLLALGIVAAAELLGVPAAQVSEGVGGAAGVLEPWLGVAVFGVGVVVFNGVRWASLPWILLVLYLAYAGQVLGGLFFGATLSAFFGALVMTPVAVIAAAQPKGPPALVSFLPGFWLLVPGALGLAGITSFLDEDRVEGIASLTTMGTSMIGIALGVLLGMAVGVELAARMTLTPSSQVGEPSA